MAHLRSKQHLEATATLTKQVYVCACAHICVCVLCVYMGVSMFILACKLSVRIDRLQSVKCLQYVCMYARMCVYTVLRYIRTLHVCGSVWTRGLTVVCLVTAVGC